jgi:hypothetical protein
VAGNASFDGIEMGVTLLRKCPVPTDCRQMNSSNADQRTRKLRADTCAPFAVKPFLPKKSVAGRWLLCPINVNLGFGYVTGFGVLAENIDVFVLRTLAAGKRRLSSSNWYFWRKSLFGWVSWGLNPVRPWSHWSMATGIMGQGRWSFQLNSSMMQTVSNKIKGYLFCGVWGWTDRCGALITFPLHAG